MAPNEEKLTISKCPKCTQSHAYTLEVQRSVSVAYTTILGSPETRGQRRSFTRLFTCPITGEDFQARFWVFEEASSKIKTVKVGNLVTESNDEPRST